MSETLNQDDHSENTIGVQSLWPEINSERKLEYFGVWAGSIMLGVSLGFLASDVHGNGVITGTTGTGAALIFGATIHAGRRADMLEAEQLARERALPSPTDIPHGQEV